MDQDRTIVDAAEVVIIGGGVIGCSIAYHLCRSGMTDVLVLERNELSSGATARAAGLMSRARSDQSTIRMITRTRQAILELEDLLGTTVDFRQVGGLRAVHTEAREQEMLTMERCLGAEGLEVGVLATAEAHRLCPWINLDGARRIIHVPGDGHIDGARLGLAYAGAARKLGARILRGVAAKGMIVEAGRVQAVATDRGQVRCRVVIDAAGAWATEVAHWLGWGFPASPTRSHYWITRPGIGESPDQPIVQLSDLRAYFRYGLGGMLVGMQEPSSWTYHALELGTEMDTVRLHDEERDTDLLIEQAGHLRAVVPGIDTWQFAHHIAGLTTYTPDGKFVLGNIPGIEGFLVAGGCCGSGLAASGGFGEAITGLVLDKPTDIDLSLFRPDRFGTVTPWTTEFRDLCSAARAGKSRGRPDPIVA